MPNMRTQLAVINTCDQQYNAPNQVQRPEYPKLPQTNRDNLRIENLQNQSIVRDFQSINNTELRLENLTNCFIFLTDLAKAITADVCINCSIILVGCSGSVFIRDCQNCRIAAISQQFRVRNCQSCSFFLLSKTDPIIETSSNLLFGPFMFSLAPSFFSEDKMVQTEDKVQKVLQFLDIDEFENHFQSIYDFSPSGKPNFTVVDCPSEFFKEIWQQPPLFGDQNAQTSNFTSNFGVAVVNFKLKSGAVVKYKFEKVPPVIFNYMLLKKGIYVVGGCKSGGVQLQLSQEEDEICSKFGGIRV
uniref:C-CAP/cofactor C-like domain-containing protein n=1 Tax=Trepomonas sp. PC1 TaxID=1076344 RepID=A0A146K308_9EUKA|eukprot:JAP91290.1 hypothetical protein TPC1_17138 [Trepomonas sp. PC1]